MENDLFGMLEKTFGKSFKGESSNPFGNAHSAGQNQAQYASVKEEPADKYANCLLIERSGAVAVFGELHPSGYVKVTFAKDGCETRAFRFNKPEIRVIANYLNDILEDV
jgi:hypothetical protein